MSLKHEKTVTMVMPDRSPPFPALFVGLGLIAGRNRVMPGYLNNLSLKRCVEV